MSKPAQAAPVLVVDDDDAVRAAIGMLLQASGVAYRAFAGAREFLDAAPWDQAACLVLDVRMPEISGIELLKQLRTRGIALPVIVMTGHGDVPMAVTAMKLGAFDFIEKPFDESHLLELISQATAAGLAAQSREAERAAATERIAGLTPREREVFELVTAGKLNKVIAYDLGLSARTVEIHRARVMEKTGAKSLSELVRLKVALEAEP
ncbi:MAG TPA: response regulator [Burkholderiales bacterium]|jgi:two-component system response regulator FixJ|nr:response regulator [Burkholderiales bacterium]